MCWPKCKAGAIRERLGRWALEFLAVAQGAGVWAASAMQGNKPKIRQQQNHKTKVQTFTHTHIRRERERDTHTRDR